MDIRELSILLEVDFSEFKKQLNQYKQGLNHWIRINEDLPKWYTPVLVLTDGDWRTNPFCDKIQVSQRHDLKECVWNNGFVCDKKVFYWAYISDVPQNFNKQIRQYQISKEIEKLKREYENL